MLTVTKKAATQLLLIANNNNVKNLLFYVKGGGCNGFNYKLKPMYEEPEKLDEIVKFDTFNLVVCSSSMLHLLGTSIDWKKDIMGETFHFENPNAGAKCGCGTSFTPKLK